MSARRLQDAEEKQQVETLLHGEWNCCPKNTTCHGSFTILKVTVKKRRRRSSPASSSR